MKVVDKVQAKIKEGTQFFSFEFFPPRTDEVWAWAWAVGRKQQQSDLHPVWLILAAAVGRGEPV